MVSSGFLQEPHGVTTQKTPFFIVTAVKTSNLTLLEVGHRPTSRRLAHQDSQHIILLLKSVPQFSPKSIKLPQRE
jgi:hypothetical protein